MTIIVFFACMNHVHGNGLMYCYAENPVEAIMIIR